MGGEGRGVMKNIPLFTSEYGVATLILEEIPTKQAGFVLVRSTDNLAGLLADGAKFCRMCGAEVVYGTGDFDFFDYQLAYELLEFSAEKHQLPKPDGKMKLVAVDDSNASPFLQKYDQIFAGQVGIGAPKLEEGIGYLVYEGEEWVGIGQIAPGRLEVIGSLKRGMGYDIAAALLAGISAEIITLQVCSLNETAIKLYEKLGFQQGNVMSQYYEI